MKKIKILMLSLLIMLFVSMPVYASEKEYTVDVGKIYTSAKISITVPDEAEYNATVYPIIPEESSIQSDKLIIPILIVIIVVLCLIITIKKNNRGDGLKIKIPKKTADKETDKTSKTNKNMLNELLSIAIPVVVVYILFWHILGITVIESESMEPTLMTGNTVFINRLAYKTGQDVNRGDVVIFKSNEFGVQFGKRVIGLPGDTIEFRDGYVVINGVYTDESAYLDADIETNCNKSFVVPDNCYFMLGDNRENSLDSRYWVNPYINKKDIIGRYMGQIDFSIKYDILNKFFTDDFLLRIRQLKQ